MAACPLLAGAIGVYGWAASATSWRRAPVVRPEGLEPSAASRWCAAGDTTLAAWNICFTARAVLAAAGVVSFSEAYISPAAGTVSVAAGAVLAAAGVVLSWAVYICAAVRAVLAAARAIAWQTVVQWTTNRAIHVVIIYVVSALWFPWARQWTRKAGQWRRLRGSLRVARVVARHGEPAPNPYFRQTAWRSTVPNNTTKTLCGLRGWRARVIPA